MTLRERCLAIDLLVLDVDGVLTEGGIIYGWSSGEAVEEIKAFHVRDGSGLKYWHLAGKQSAIVTGRSSPLVALRAEELGIRHVLQGEPEKLKGLQALQHTTGCPPSSICYIGDDLPDATAMQAVGLAVAVADACADTKAAAHFQTRAPGGKGAVREVIELVLRCQGLWPQRATAHR